MLGNSETSWKSFQRKKDDFMSTICYRCKMLLSNWNLIIDFCISAPGRVLAVHVLYIFLKPCDFSLANPLHWCLFAQLTRRKAAWALAGTSGSFWTHRDALLGLQGWMLLQRLLIPAPSEKMCTVKQAAFTVFLCSLAFCIGLMQNVHLLVKRR